MKKKTQIMADLSPAQRELMEIVWTRGEASGSEIRKILPSHRVLARNTVRTMLLRMEDMDGYHAALHAKQGSKP